MTSMVLRWDDGVEFSKVRTVWPPTSLLDQALLVMELLNSGYSVRMHLEDDPDDRP